VLAANLVRKRLNEWFAAVRPALVQVIGARRLLADSVAARAGEVTNLPVRAPTIAPGPLPPSFWSSPGGTTARQPTTLTGDEGVVAVVLSRTNAPPSDAKIQWLSSAGPSHDDTRVKGRARPSPATAVYEQGRAHLGRGAYNQAAVALTEAIRLAPDHVAAIFSRGISFQLDGRYPQALDDYNEVIRRRPSADVYLLRGKTYHVLGKDDLALADLSKALRLRPGDVNSYLARGGVFYALGKYGEAIADYTEAIRLRPADSGTHYRRGMVRYNSGDYSGAIADFSEAIRCEPNHQGAYRYRSEAYARRGDSVRALGDHGMVDRLSSGLARTGQNKVLPTGARALRTPEIETSALLKGRRISGTDRPE
jgi:tetratricopeptide (TPR) repeat protein